MKLLPSQILMMERIARERDCILTHADSANASLCSGLGLIKISGDGSAELTEAGWLQLRKARTPPGD